MFKRLRERIAEEATKFPVAQLGNNSGKPLSESENNKPLAAISTEDLITLSDSSAVVVPHTSSQQFSIGEEDDASVSESSTPQKKNDVSAGSELYSASNKEHNLGNSTDVNFFREYRPSKLPPYIPQSDIESEKEEPPTLNLEGISTHQLLAIIQTLKARTHKYKNKYAEVVKNYKEIRDEKIKIENTLIENQDKSLRRLAELREQCQLEQKAKAHLEENLRLLLEEKDSRISVLETQINLLKAGGKSNSAKTPEDNVSLTSESAKSEDETTSYASDAAILQEKIERLEHQRNQDKNTLTAQKEQISLLRKQNESLTQELEVKVKRLNELEDQQVVLKAEHEVILKKMQDRLEDLEKQQEESIMSMAETKKNMHEELELKEKQLNKAEEEARQHQATVEHERALIVEMKKQHEENINELQRQLTTLEKTLEEEKQNLMQELTRGKTAAITLMQQECVKKVAAVEEEWKIKYQALQSQNESSLQLKIEELSALLNEKEETLKSTQQNMDELESSIVQLRKENASLKNTIEKLESKGLEEHQEDRIKSIADKFQVAETNYKSQIEELKSRIMQLESEKAKLESEVNEKVKTLQSKLEHGVESEHKIQLELKSKENEIKILQEKYEVLNKEQLEKILFFQENMKDKENMILKLKTNLSNSEKENGEKIIELNKKIKQLEQEREQLMLQAQERVSTTESKYREDIKLLQDENKKLRAENKEIETMKTEIKNLKNQLSENQQASETKQAISEKEVSNLQEKLATLERKLSEMTTCVSKEKELELLVQKLEKENVALKQSGDYVEKLKAEKEELNERLKNTEKQVISTEHFESELSVLRTENEKLNLELSSLKSLDKENELLAQITSLEKHESELKSELENLIKEKENLNLQKSIELDKFHSEINILKAENETLLKKINILEQFDASDSENSSIKDYVTVIKGECERAIKSKEEEMEKKLKHLIKDFCKQVDSREKNCDQIVSELLEKNQCLEEKLRKEHQIEMVEIRQELFEKQCALEEIRDHYEEILQEKNAKLKEYEQTVNELSSKTVSESNSNPQAEGSDWDDTWVVPDEVIENHSPVHSSKSCQDHLQLIQSLKEELEKSNSEIKELKVLLRLSPPDSLVTNNNHQNLMQPILEPTEFEYLRNIIYDYMMGKAPVTLAKVIAAVLKFNETQTRQILRREESRHPMK